MKDKILIIGCGRLGSSIASLLSSQGENVIILDKTSSSFRKLADSFGGFSLVGDATDQYTLETDVGIKDVSEVFITTNNDNTNLFIAHLCHFIYHVPHIYVRFFDTDKSKLIEHTAIEAIYPATLSMDSFMKHRRKGETL